MRNDSQKILVTRSSLPPLEEYVEKLKRIWETAWLTNMGEYHEELRERLKAYLGVPGLELFANGHLGLEFAIQAFGLKGQVITTPFSFASTTHAIVRNGLTPVFCDIREDDYTLDAEQIEDLITEETCAIIPTHVYGHICQVEKIGQIARKHGLKVIYDAAHAFGETWDGIEIGRFGDASMFSFHATKVFHTIEGGAVAFQEPWLEDILYKLKNFGITGKESVEYVGGNGKMNEFQAAMGLCNLEHIEASLTSREQAAVRYRSRLSNIKGIRLALENPRVKSNYAYFPVVFDGYQKDRDTIYQHLADHNIFARKYFYPCINEYGCYEGRFRPEDTPVAKEISRKVLTLPIYDGMDLDVVDEICQLILDTE